MTYTPQASSVAGRALAHFAANPDTVLSLEDAADKFNCTVSALRSLLSDAVSAQYLTRVVEDGDWVYKAGPNLKAVPKSAHTAAGAQVRVFGRTDPPPPPPAASNRPDRYEFIDPNKVVLEEGIPLVRPRGRVAEDWDPLLLKMTTTQSFILPTKKRNGVSRAIAELHKAKQGRWALAVMPDKVYFRVWRTELAAAE